MQLRFDAARRACRSGAQRAIKLAGQSATKDGVIVIEANRFRTQERNRADARERLVALIAKAAEPPPPPRKKDQANKGLDRTPSKDKIGPFDVKKLRGKGEGRLDRVVHFTPRLSDCRSRAMPQTSSDKQQGGPDMGIFDFVKSVGKKLGIGDDDDAEARKR